MIVKFVLKSFLFLFFLTVMFSCGPQEDVVKEEKHFLEEEIDIETNAIFTTEETTEISNQLKVLILPFEDKSDQAAYPNSKIVKTIVQNELYAFLYTVPSFNVPDKDVLSGMNSTFLSGKIITSEEIFSNYQANIIIYGDYALKGKKTDPTAQIQMKIWNRVLGISNAGTYKTTLDADIFDTMDAMLSNIISLTLNQNVKLAFLNFGNFKIGKGSYALIINNKLVSKITNNAYSLNLKILPNAVYTVKLRDLTDYRIVFNSSVMLKPGEMTNFSYSALGKVRFTMTNQTPDEKFQIFLNGDEVKMDEDISNIQAEDLYSLQVLNKTKNNYYWDTFYLSDGESKNLIIPKDKFVVYALTTDYMPVSRLYNSENSIAKFARNTNYIFHDRKCFSINYFVNPKGGYANIFFGNEYFKNIDWKDINTLKLWIFGRMTQRPYFIQIFDKGNELYWYWMKDDWQGWNQVCIPFKSFKFRTPYQPSNAKINHILDFPLSGLGIEMNSHEKMTSCGYFRLTIGDVEATRE